MNCPICGLEVLNDSDSLYLSNRIAHQMGLERQTRINFTGSRAHIACIDDHELIDPSDVPGWTTWHIRHLKKQTAEIKQSIRRLEDAILELPEDMAPRFRDEIQHIRETYPDM